MVAFCFFQAEEGIRDPSVTGVQPCAFPIFTAKNVGAAATTAPVTVTATLTTGATATAITGSGWNCTLSTLTCTRSDTLAASATYPAIAVRLSYDLSPGSVVQTATVSGGGEVNTANDTVSLTVTVIPPVTMFIPNPSATVPA